ncbi:hypothetical protein DPMN_110936 [Dreissena polymorpha]|uniref:Uncharacterized protein n=1 Tax=Dreissena polymorpha TaxID=45954 RepID=A0A9D4KDI3_DREPO|nr:hypothetical protein DPMN_110936 [Dreissena polymorpha]
MIRSSTGRRYYNLSNQTFKRFRDESNVQQTSYYDKTLGRVLTRETLHRFIGNNEPIVFPSRLY